MSGATPRRTLALAALFMGAAGVALGSAGGAGRAEAPDVTGPGEAEVLELDLAFFEARIARDAFAARDHAELARLYLRRARLSATPDGDLARAEEHAGRSLELRTAHNR